MVITYQGDNYFKLQAGSLTLLIDPLNQRSFKGADIILNTVKPAAIEGHGEEEGFLWIDHQGEYEKKDIIVNGWSASNDGGREKTVYLVNFEGAAIAVLGQLAHDLNQETVDALSGAQVVIGPAGGKPFADQATVAKIIRAIGPSVIIPSLFKDLKPFLKEFKRTACETEEKLVFKAKDLKPGALEIKCLKS